MNLKEEIFKDFTSAIKNKEEIVKNVLGNIKTNIILEEKIKNINKDDILNILQKEVKKLESIININGIKENLKLEAIQQREVLKKYFPKQMSEDEVIAILNKHLKEGKVEKNIGSLMRFSKEKFQGRFDMKKVSLIVKDLIK